MAGWSRSPGRWRQEADGTLRAAQAGGPGISMAVERTGYLAGGRVRICGNGPKQQQVRAVEVRLEYPDRRAAMCDKGSACGKDEEEQGGQGVKQSMQSTSRCSAELSAHQRAMGTQRCTTGIPPIACTSSHLLAPKSASKLFLPSPSGREFRLSGTHGSQRRLACCQLSAQKQRPMGAEVLEGVEPWSL